MSEQLHPTPFDMNDQPDARSPENKDKQIDQLTPEETGQLEKSFERLATVLKGADWDESSIGMFIKTIYTGSIDSDTVTFINRLEANLPYVSLRPGEQLLWEQWTTGMTLEELRAEYRDDEHYSIHKLRLQIAAVVAKIGAQTF